MTSTLRWLAVAPAVILGLCLGILLTMWLISGADWLTYKYEGSSDGLPWWDDYLFPAAKCLGAALTAFFVVSLTVLVAPAKRLPLARTVFCAGAVLALSILSAKGEYGPLIAAIAGGLLAVLLTKWLTASGITGIDADKSN